MNLKLHEVECVLEIAALLYVLQEKLQYIQENTGLVPQLGLRNKLKVAYEAIEKEVTAQMASNTDANTLLFLSDVDKLVDILEKFKIDGKVYPGEHSTHVVDPDKKYIAGPYIGKTPLEVASIDPGYVLTGVNSKTVSPSKELLDICLQAIKQSKTRTAIC